MEKNKTVYSIGQILTYTQDVKTHRIFSDTPEVIKKGTKIIVGADGFVRYPDGSIQKLSEDIEVSGYVKFKFRKGEATKNNTYI